MKKTSILLVSLLGLASAQAASFSSPHNIVVLRCAGAVNVGNAGFLDEYTPSGSLVQSITLPQNGTTDTGSSIVFGASTALIHSMSLSADGALVVIPGYAAMAASGNVESSTASAIHRVIATVKWDGTYARPNADSHWASNTSGERGAASDGFGNFWGIWTGGCSYLGNNGPYVNLNGTGMRAGGIVNGNLYVSVTLGVDYFTSGTNSGGMPIISSSGGQSTAVYFAGPSSGTYGTMSSAGWAIPSGLPVPCTAYVANYNTSGHPTITPFTWDGSTWTTQNAMTMSGTGMSGNPLWLAVDFSGTYPVLYFTTTVSANGVWSFTDTSVGGANLWGTTATATRIVPPSGTLQYRGIVMAPTQPALPVFTTQPVNSTNFYGDTVTFGPVAATGANPYAWIWTLGGITLTNGNNGRSSTVSGATTPTLTISGITAADAGSYYAIASNNGGSTPSSPALLVLHGSCINPQLVSITNVAGTTANFTAGVSACAGPIASYSWTLNGNPLSDGVTGTGSTISGSATASLTVAGVQDGDAGLYSITLIDANSQPSSSAASLTVLDFPVITQEPAVQNKTAGATANFTIAASGGSLFYNWFKSPSSIPLTNGPTGTGATISGANTPTLTIAGVQAGDAGTYTVTVTNLAGAQPSNPAMLTIGLAPFITTPAATAEVPAGSNATFTVVAGGTPTLSYTWKFNGTTLTDDGVHIAGSATASLTISNVAASDKGTYAVTVANDFGSTNSSVLLIYVPPPLPCQLAGVPEQIVYEPFNYDTQPTTQSSSNPWTALNVETITNQATGVSLVWVNTGTIGQVWTLPQDMRIESGYDNSTLTPNGDSYPWPGLAGTDPQEVACNSGNAGVALPLGTGGSISNGTVYFSMICHVDQGSGLATVGTDYFCGFGAGSPASPAYNAGIYIHTPGDDTYIPGVFKASGGAGALSPGVNGNWSTKAFHRGQIIFVVCRLTINPGVTNDTCDLWLNPSPFAFNASEANLPPADVANVGAGAPDVGNVDFLWIKDTLSPFSRRFTDLRIGRTWASVTPPSAPTLSLVNVLLPPGATTAVFPSHNVGNPVDCGSYAGSYAWQFNGRTLSDDGIHILGSTTATLTIVGVTAADLGTYTVTGTNIDPLNSYSDPAASPPVNGDRVFNPTGTNLVGSASATLTFLPPSLSVAYSSPNIIISWPTNWTGYTLEQTPAADPTAWTTNSSPPYPIVGTNYTKSVNASSGAKFFRLKQ
jgi:hypothetical protein